MQILCCICRFYAKRMHCMPIYRPNMQRICKKLPNICKGYAQFAKQITLKIANIFTMCKKYAKKLKKQRPDLQNMQKIFKKYAKTMQKSCSLCWVYNTLHFASICKYAPGTLLTVSRARNLQETSVISDNLNISERARWVARLLGRSRGHGRRDITPSIEE